MNGEGKQDALRQAANVVEALFFACLFVAYERLARSERGVLSGADRLRSGCS
jgi:hypothetical protein